ncbi:MAG: aminopeptidase P family N-terminal domain-containing protein [Parabacteroides merdae]
MALTFNIRGTDVVYNPVVISYAFVSRRKAYCSGTEEDTR